MPSLLETIQQVEQGRSATPDGQPSGLQEQQQSVEDVRGEGGVSFTERVRQREQLRERGVHARSPQQADVQSREEFLGGQLMERGFGPRALGDPGLNDTALRFDLGLSDTFEEKKIKFLDKYPSGDFIQVSEPPEQPGVSRMGRGGQTVLFRRNPEEPFAEMDAGALEKFELIGDLSDLSGEIPAIVMEALVTRGGGLARQALQLMAGTFTGDQIKEAAESLRGYQRETFTEQMGRQLTRSGFSAAGGAATSIATGPINSLRGASAIGVSPGARQAQRSARELDIPPLLPNQIASSPIIQRMGRQSQATVSTINEYIRNQQEAAVRSIGRLRDEDALRFAKGDLRKVHDQAVEQITSAAQASNTSLTEGGTAIQQGIVEYEDLSRAIVDRAYTMARERGAPEFDISPALATAREIRQGVVGRGRGGEDVQLQDVAPAIRSEIEKLENLDPDLPTVTVTDADGNPIEITGTDQLRAIRQNLWNLKQTGPTGTTTPEERRTAAQASKLYSAIDHVLKNPRNADEGFVNAWQQANTEAAKRFDTLEKMIVVQATKNETPAQMANRLAKPLQVDNLRTLRNTVSDSNYSAFQESVKSDFLAPENVDNLTKRLSQFDRETLDLLLPRAEQQQLREIGQQIDRLNNAGIQDVLARQDSVTAAVRDLVQRQDTAGLEEFVNRALRFDTDSPQRKMIRAGVMEDLWNRVVRRSENTLEIDRNALRTEIKRLRDNDIMRLMTPGDRKVIRNFENVVDFLGSTEDAGTSLQAASAAASIRALNMTGFFTLAETIGTGRLFINPLGQRILLGSGREKLPFSKTRILGALLARTQLDGENGQSNRRQGTSMPQR